MPIVEHRTFGPPGCGKTTYVSGLVGRIAEQYGPRAVLVASFTRAAAVELAGRDLPIDRSFVGTLHALCYRALGRPTIAETKLDEWNAENRNRSLSATGTPDPEDGNAMRYDSGGEVVTGKAGDEAYARMNLFRAKLIPREMWPESVRAFADRWEAWKYENDYIDFTDMIEKARLHVEYAPGRPPFGIFDEVQDFTPLELALVRHWAEGMEYIMMAGDDDQTLYRFTGATPDAFLNPPIPDAQKHVLDQSYRVPRAIQRTAEAWIAHVSRREPKAYKPKDVEGFVLPAPPTGTFKNPEPLITHALQHVDNGQSVMFLASCSYMLESLKHTLREAGIPFHNPYRRKRGDWNPLAASRGTSASERLLAYLHPDPHTWGEDAVMWTHDDIYKWATILKSKGVLKPKAKEALEACDGLHEPVTMELLAEIFEEDLGWDLLFDTPPLHWFEENLLAAKAKSMEFPLRVARARGGHLLRETPKIILGTIHSVKGGEADIVYLFPDLSRAGMQEWMQRGEPRDSIYRLLYVGMTRAKEGLYLCRPSSGMAVTLPV